MVLEEMHNGDLREATRTRVAVTSAGAADQREVEGAVAEARAEDKRSDQAKSSRRVTRTMEGGIPASMTIDNFRELRKCGGRGRQE